MPQIQLYLTRPSVLRSIRQQMLWFGDCSNVSSLLDTLKPFWLSQLLCHPPNLSWKVRASPPAVWAFLLSKILHSLENQKSSLLNTDEPILPTVHVQCLLSAFIHFGDRCSHGYLSPLEYFLALLPTKALSPLTTVKRKKSYAAFDDYCFVILMLLLFPSVCEKEQRTSLVLLTRTVISNSKTQWKLQDMQKKIALYSYKKKK